MYENQKKGAVYRPFCPKIFSYAASEAFLYRPLAEHQLPTRLYHLLLSKECWHMEDVISLGLPGLRSTRGIGKGSVKALRSLLERNRCGRLL